MHCESIPSTDSQRKPTIEWRRWSPASPRQWEAKPGERFVTTSHGGEEARELANRPTRDRPLRAPDNSRVFPALIPPVSVERLEVGAIVGDDNAAVGGRYGELFFVGQTTARPTDFVDRERVDAQVAKRARHLTADIFIDQEGQTHVARFSAMRASISSG